MAPGGAINYDDEDANDDNNDNYDYNNDDDEVDDDVFSKSVFLRIIIVEAISK